MRCFTHAAREQTYARLYCFRIQNTQTHDNTVCVGRTTTVTDLEQFATSLLRIRFMNFVLRPCNTRMSNKLIWVLSVKF